LANLFVREEREKEILENKRNNFLLSFFSHGKLRAEKVLARLALERERERTRAFNAHVSESARALT
jgi:hypothetical protein